MDYGLLAPMSVGQVHCSSSGSESCKGRGPNRCWISTWIHPYTPTHYLLGALFLSCRVLHKYPGFVAPSAAQVPKGASSFAVFVLQGAAQVPCFCCSRCCASTYRGLIFCSVSRFCFHRRNGSQNGSDNRSKNGSHFCGCGSQSQ